MRQILLCYTEQPTVRLRTEEKDSPKFLILIIYLSEVCHDLYAIWKVLCNYVWYVSKILMDYLGTKGTKPKLYLFFHSSWCCQIVLNTALLNLIFNMSEVLESITHFDDMNKINKNCIEHQAIPQCIKPMRRLTA